MLGLVWLLSFCTASSYYPEILDSYNGSIVASSLIVLSILFMLLECRMSKSRVVETTYEGGGYEKLVLDEFSVLNLLLSIFYAILIGCSCANYFRDKDVEDLWFLQMIMLYLWVTSIFEPE